MTTAPNVTVDTPDGDSCHGCSEWGSRGWIIVIAEAQRCPVCMGSGKKPQQYVYYPPIQIQPPVYIPTVWIQQPCPWCGRYNCHETHIILGDISNTGAAYSGHMTSGGTLNGNGTTQYMISLFNSQKHDRGC